MSSQDPKFFVECFLCKRDFQYGPHIYAGRPIKPWKISVCTPCIDMNWDGVVPDSHPDLIPHLQSEGVAFELNAEGWLKIPPRG